MHKSFNAREIEQFRRHAKLQAKSYSEVKYQSALNMIARDQGYQNWSVLMKHTNLDAVGSTPFLLLRTDEEMAQAMRLVPEPRHDWRSYQTRGDYARSMVEDIQARFVSAANAVDFAIAYMESALRVRRYSVPSASVAQQEMRLWLPYSALGMGLNYSAPQILVNRRYKPVGDATGLHAIYEDHTHLHLSLAQEHLQIFSHAPGSEGFLYNDGCLPWRSRRYAEEYLARLRLLHLAMQRLAS
jgi:hypothetical protein